MEIEVEEKDSDDDQKCPHNNPAAGDYYSYWVLAADPG